MDVSCPACAARYTANAEKLRGKTARMRCKACDTVWLVSGPELKAAADLQGETGERRAAVVKRGTEREKRDLFAPRPMDQGSVRQTLRPPPPAALSSSANDDDGPTGVGARNESSVLFTVDALARNATARMKTPPPTAATARLEPRLAPEISAAAVDDDGIIDLKALSSAPPRARGMEVPSLFPSEPPPSAFARDADHSAAFAAQGKASNRKKMIAFGAIAASVAVAVVGLAFLFKGPAPAPVSAAPPPLAATAEMPKTETPPAVTTTTSSDSGASTDKPDDEKGHKKGHKGWKGKPTGKPSGGGGGVSLPPAPKAAASDPCGCHGDFNCQLRCSAKGK